MTQPINLFSGMTLPDLTSAQQKIMAHVLSNPEDAAYLSSAGLAGKLSISNATIVRFSQHIGFKGYLDLQRHIRQKIKDRLNVPERVQKKSPDVLSSKDFLKAVFKSDCDNLALAARDIDECAFENFVNDLHSAKDIWVVGLRSFFGSAHSFATNLRFLGHRVNLIGLDAGTVWSEIQHGLHQDALLISISFPRYSRQTIDITRLFFEAGARVAAITDSSMSPLAKMGTHLFYLPFWIDSFFESSTTVTSFLNAALAATAFLNGSKTVDRIHRLEQIWDEQNIYEPQNFTERPSWTDRLTDHKNSRG